MSNPAVFSLLALICEVFKPFTNDKTITPANNPGRNNTIANIVHAHDSGQSLKSIYKVIKEIYRKEVKDASINH